MRVIITARPIDAPLSQINRQGESHRTASNKHQKRVRYCGSWY
jgi:hypothetical protein